MPKEKVVSYTTEELKALRMSGGDKTDWERVRSMTDEDIIFDEDAPEITEEMFVRAFTSRNGKTEIKVVLDTEE